MDISTKKHLAKSFINSCHFYEMSSTNNASWLHVEEKKKNYIKDWLIFLCHVTIYDRILKENKYDGGSGGSFGKYF